MCYFNGQKVTHAEFIRLKHLEKALARYDFLGRDLQIGFDYGLNAVLKPIPGKEDFEIVQMEWGFIPSYLKTREDINRMRHGYKDANGKFHPPITTLNAVSEELLLPGKIYKEAALKEDAWCCHQDFMNGGMFIHLINVRGNPLRQPINTHTILR